MQHLEHEEEQPIYSEEAKRLKKIKEFKEYLVNSGTVLHFIKFMLGIRNKQKADDSVPNEDALKMFHDYIGAVQIDMTQHDQLKKAIQQGKEQGENLKRQIEDIKKQIQQKKLQKEKAEQEKRLRQQEQAAKNKKGGKK